MFRFFHYLTEILGWLQIAASPFLLCAAAGTVVYYNMQNTTGLVIAIAIAVVGLVLGIWLATRKWKKGGTVNFISKIHATPDIDEWLKKDKK